MRHFAVLLDFLDYGLMVIFNVPSYVEPNWFISYTAGKQSSTRSAGWALVDGDGLPALLFILAPFQSNFIFERLKTDHLFLRVDNITTNGLLCTASHEGDRVLHRVVMESLSFSVHTVNIPDYPESPFWGLLMWKISVGVHVTQKQKLGLSVRLCTSLTARVINGKYLQPKRFPQYEQSRSYRISPHWPLRLNAHLVWKDLFVWAEKRSSRGWKSWKSAVSEINTWKIWWHTSKQVSCFQSHCSAVAFLLMALCTSTGCI